MKIYDPLPNFDSNIMYEIETDMIFKKSIKNKEDSQLNNLIEKLKNYDWVHDGVSYLKNSNNCCPFCQTKLNQELINEINALFDEEYEKSLEKIKKLISKYENELQCNYEFEEIPNIDYNNLKIKLDNLKNNLQQNLQLMKTKLKKPSKSIQIKSSKGLINNIKNEINNIDKQIKEVNEFAKKAESEKNKLATKFRQYIINIILKSYYENYKVNLDNLKNEENENKAIKAKLENDNKNLESEIVNLTKSLTSIKTAIININKTLKSFGYNGFKFIVKGDEKLNQYEIVRNNGVSVGDTLSEGERNFITFLYFFERIRGSFNKEGNTKRKIIVIDDPISSLDNKIIFIVSSLIKNLIFQITKPKENKFNVEQIFVFTHNVYFHNEIAYKTNKNTKYYILNKIAEKTMIESYKNNKKLSAYDMLWKEVLTGNNKETIFNAMRRILENYFKIIGGINNENNLLEKFEKEDKLICRALISLLHSESHNIFDDYFYSIQQCDLEDYQKIFKQIFENSGQIGHYNMMKEKYANNETENLVEKNLA